VDEQVRSLEEAEQHIRSLTARQTQLEAMVFEFNRMFEVLQTPLLKRIWFRIDGWSGQSDLGQKKPRWRPWRRWYTS
jgi:phytoene dehydrogenase-like protein